MAAEEGRRRESERAGERERDRDRARARSCEGEEDPLYVAHRRCRAFVAARSACDAQITSVLPGTSPPRFPPLAPRSLDPSVHSTNRSPPAYPPPAAVAYWRCSPASYTVTPPVPFSPLVHRRRHCRSPSPCSPTLPHTTVARSTFPLVTRPPVLLLACLPACHPLTLPSRRLSASTFAPRPLSPPACLFPRHAATRSLATVPRRVLRRAARPMATASCHPTLPTHDIYTHTHTHVGYV